MDRKHCGEKEKLLVTSNFSFSHSVFQKLLYSKHVKTKACLGKGLTLLLLFLLSSRYKNDGYLIGLVRQPLIIEIYLLPTMFSKTRLTVYNDGRSTEKSDKTQILS